MTVDSRRLPYDTVAVTGASGYIGTALTAALMDTAARTLAVSRDPTRARHLAMNPARAEVLTADVQERACWDELVRRANVIFHLAGNTSVYAEAANPEESFKTTIQPVVHLVAAAREADRRPRLLFASTATVYGLTECLPVSEDVEPHPATVYDLHKWAAEQQLQQASAEGVLDAVSLRLANVYGPSSGLSSAGDRGVLNRVVTAILGGSDIVLYGDGRYVRDYVYIDDAVGAFLAAGIQPGITGRVFNVATGQGIMVRDAFRLVADRVAQVTQHRARVREVAWPEGVNPIEFRNFAGDIRSISAACGWRPTVPLSEGIDRLIASLIDK